MHGSIPVFAILILVIGVASSSKTPISNQYCFVASFYMGLFGSMCFANIIRIFLNAMLADKVYENNSSCLRFLISSEAVEIIRDIKRVRIAEK